MRLNSLITLCLFCLMAFDVAPVVVAQEAGSVRSNQESESAAFYEPAVVQTVHLQIAADDRNRMLDALPERIYVPATFRWRDIVVDRVAVRFKGNSSSHPRQMHKRSYLVRFDEYQKDQRFLGLQRASLDNGVQFGSLFSEPIITEILRAEGVPTHRCNYARLVVNDEYQGVYVNVERIDETFIESRFGDADGPLYKVDLGGPGCNLQLIGLNPDAYKQAFESKSDSAKEKRGQLVDLIRMINQADADEFRKQIEESLELDDFLNVTAVMLLSGAFDQLTGWNHHNYYLYRDTETDRWHYLPWDLDVGFCETAFGKINVLADWNAAWPVPSTSGHNPLLERIIDDPVLLQRYRIVARRILEEHFEPDDLCAVVDAKYALIKEHLASDPFPHRRVTVPSDQNYDGIVEAIKGFIRKRHTSALEQLDAPGTRPERRPQNSGLPPQLEAKIQRILRGTQKMQQAGKDVRPIQQLMQNVGRRMEQGKREEAEEILDQVLKLVEAGQDE